jgi:ribosomal protein L4
MANVLKAFKKQIENLKGFLIVSPSLNNDLYRAAKNIQKLNVIEARNLNPLEVLSNKNLMIMKDSIKEIGKLKN